jgi:hypothetical protein
VWKHHTSSTFALWISHFTHCGEKYQFQMRIISQKCSVICDAWEVSVPHHLNGKGYYIRKI